MGRQRAPDTRLQPRARRGQLGQLALAERSQRELPRLAQPEPHARRARLDAGNTLRPGVLGGLLARNLLRTGNGDAEPHRAHRDEK